MKRPNVAKAPCQAAQVGNPLAFDGAVTAHDDYTDLQHAVFVGGQASGFGVDHCEANVFDTQRIAGRHSGRLGWRHDWLTAVVGGRWSSRKIAAPSRLAVSGPRMRASSVMSAG